MVEIVFRNSLPNAVNLVMNGGLIPDSVSYLTAAVAPGTTVSRWKRVDVCHSEFRNPRKLRHTMLISPLSRSFAMYKQCR